jgi:hypothetical protein
MLPLSSTLTLAFLSGWQMTLVTGMFWMAGILEKSGFSVTLGLRIL